MDISKLKTLFRFEPRDIIRISVTFVLALIDFILLCQRYPEASAGILMFLLLSVPVIRVKGRFRFILDIIFPAYIALFVMYYFQAGMLYGHPMLNALEYFWGYLLIQNRVFYEFAFVFAVYFLLRFFVASPKVAAIITPIPFMLLALINYYVYMFRGHEFVFNDFISTQTAFNVAGGYNFPLEVPLVFMILPYLVFISFFVAMEIEKSEVHIAIREPVFAAVSALCVFLSIVSVDSWFSAGNHIFREWGDMMSVMNGYYLSFAESVKASIITAPSGYSKGELDEILKTAGYDGAGLLTYDEEPANIIVIMNESYTDLSIYQDITGPTDNPDPYWDSLKDNTVKGYAFSSVYGGNTANSEFEFLTGLSMANLPASSIVYHSYIKDNIYSIVRATEDIGYDTYVMHPYLSDGWNRLTVYPLLGFDHMYFMDDMHYGNEDLICGKISDSCAYRNMMEILDEHDRNSSNKTFTYLITMQNHGGYDDEDYARDTYTTVFDEYNNRCFNNFMTMESESDKALEELFTELSSRDEKYAVLIFGDHQPELSLASSEDFLAGGRAWVVPYLIWTNYDLPERTLVDMRMISSELTSLNYLSLDILKAAGLKYNNYYDLISGVRSEIPLINSAGYALRDGSCHDISEDIPAGAAGDKMRLYSYIEYNILHDGNDSLLFRNYVYN